MTGRTEGVTPGVTALGVADRPVMFEDSHRNAAYWARVDRIVDQAPPLTDTQRAVIRAAFHAPALQEAA